MPSKFALLAIALVGLGVGPCHRVVATDRCTFEWTDSSDAFLTKFSIIKDYFGPVTGDPKAEEAFGTKVRQACDALPAHLRWLVNKHVRKVLIVSAGDSPTALAAMEHPDGPDSWGVLIFNRNAARGDDSNALITAKERTLFVPGVHQVSVRLTDTTNDGLTSYLQYVLLHEMAHLASYAAGWVAGDWEGVRPADAALRYPFYRFSWLPDGDGWRLKWEVPYRDSLASYGKSGGIPNEAMPSLYARIAESGVINTYAAVRPVEDAAESIAAYAHVFELQRPLTTTVDETTFRSCLETERCQGLRAFLADYFARVRQSASESGGR